LPIVRVAIVSHVLPPTWSGQAMILARLLSGFSQGDYVLVRTMNLPFLDEDAYEQPLPAPTFRLPKTFVPALPGAPRERLATARSLGTTLWSRARGIARIVRRERCGAVVACTGGDMLDIPAGWLGARLARVPYYPYFFDRWSQQSQGPPERRRFAERWERRIVTGAARVIVPNEFLARELEQTLGARTAVVRNACVVPDEVGDPSPAGDPARIAYTGAVYAANHDTFRNLIASIGLLERAARLDIYTAQSAAELEAAGIVGPVMRHDHLPAADVRRVQGDADILFLPLAFESPYPSLIRTSNPGKMGEYLAAGRPILVHAPPDSFVADYFRRHGCGVVVDRPDPDELARRLNELLGDNALRRRVSAAARECALADYDIRRARADFARTVGLKGAG
jgi:glycosyltransferase involved in cell wall biosynthesis